MKSKLWITVLLVVCWALPAAGGMYKYTAADGTVCYTDDLSKVPEDQRDAYIREQAAAEPSATAAPALQEESAPGASAGQPTAAKASADNWPVYEQEEPPSGESLSDIYTRLETTRRQLKAEQTDIEKEKAALAAMKEDATTTVKIKAYNEKARAINERIQELNKKTKAFETELDNYNDRVREDLDRKEAEKAQKTQQ